MASAGDNPAYQAIKLHYKEIVDIIVTEDEAVLKYVLHMLQSAYRQRLEPDAESLDIDMIENISSLLGLDAKVRLYLAAMASDVRRYEDTFGAFTSALREIPASDSVWRMLERKLMKGKEVNRVAAAMRDKEVVMMMLMDIVEADYEKLKKVRDVHVLQSSVPQSDTNAAQQIFVNCRSEILQATAHVEPDVLTKALFEAAIIDELVLVDMLNERKDIREALWITVQEQLRIGQNKWKSLLEVLKQFVDEKLLSELKEYYSLLSLGLTGVRLEVKVYQKYKIDLFKLIEEPAELTNQLFSCGLVTKPVADEIKLCPNSALSKRMLLFAIECKLRKSMEYQLREREDAFDSLCSILKKFPSTAQLADEMCIAAVQARKLGRIRYLFAKGGAEEGTTEAASIIASSEYEEIIEQAVARDPIVTAFSCCEHGVIEKETLADILTSFNAEEHLLDKIKFAVLTDQQVVEKFCDVLASFPEKVELIKKFKDVKLCAEVEVIAEETFEVKGSEMVTFDRMKEYGFKMEVPGGSLTKKESCVVQVKACLPKACPVGSNLVSAVYELTVPGSERLPMKAVNITIEHCASVDYSTELCFIVSKGDVNSPLKFYDLEGTRGRFDSCCGKITLYSFSWLAICYMGNADTTKYAARVYVDESLVRKTIQFVLLRQLAAHRKAIEDLFSSYREECLVPSVVFSENSTAVTLRVKEKEEHGGWKIWPSYFPAKIRKSVAKEFRKGKDPATCKLFAEVVAQEAENFLYTLFLQGIDEPECVNINLSSKQDIESSPLSPKNSKISMDRASGSFCAGPLSPPGDLSSPSLSSTGTASVNDHSLKDVPTLGPEHLDVLAAVVDGAKEKWKDVGKALDFPASELQEVARAMDKDGDNFCLQELLKRWLDRAPPLYPFPHVKQLADALRTSAKKHKNAYDLEHHPVLGCL